MGRQTNDSIASAVTVIFKNNNFYINCQLLLERIIAYIDGFNLYFGLKSKGWKRYYWLNQKKLIQNILQKEQKLILTKYFTSRVSSPPDKVKRQNDYLEALDTLDDFKIYFGHFLDEYIECFRCGNIIYKPSEKMTDVNIAVEMLKDSYDNAFDKAILVSADSDLFAPIKAIKKLFPNKKVVCAFPPNRHSFQLTTIADGYFTIGRKKIADSQFEEQIVNKSGFVLTKPDLWK